MLGLKSQFHAHFEWVVFIVLASAGVAGACALVAHRRRRPVLQPAARTLACGAVLVVLAGTAIPTNLHESLRGYVALGLGDGGLSDWRVIWTDTNSLASVLLVLNAALFIPVAFFGTLGWPGRTSWVVLGCLGLSVGVETAQYLALGRVAATDDVLLNVAGTVIGATMGQAVGWWWASRLRRRVRNEQSSSDHAAWAQGFAPDG